MKELLNRLFTLLLVLTILEVCALPSLALQVSNSSGPVYEVTYVTINNPSASLTVSGGTATCKATLTSKKSVPLKINAVLQRKTGSTWTNVQSWTSSKTGTSLTLLKIKSVASGGAYRLKVTFTAGSETVSRTVYP